MKLLQSARCRFSGSMKARLRPRVLEASVRWWLLLAPTAATLRRVPPSRDDDALTRRTPRSRYSFGGGGMRRPWRDDEVDERKIAHAFIEKLKDDMDKLREQVTALGGQPVL